MVPERHGPCRGYISILCSGRGWKLFCRSAAGGWLCRPVNLVSLRARGNKRSLLDAPGNPHSKSLPREFPVDDRFTPGHIAGYCPPECAGPGSAGAAPALATPGGRRFLPARSSRRRLPGGSEDPGRPQDIAPGQGGLNPCSFPLQKVFYFYRVNIFYVSPFSGSRVELSEEESLHCVRVLRMKAGDEIRLADGKGNFYKARITRPHDKHCEAELLEAPVFIPQRPYSIHLAVAPTKSSDRYEWLLEKITELGCERITPLLCTHSERTRVKSERLQKVL